MRPQTPSLPPAHPPQGATRPGVAETAQRWQDVGGIEGISLEWMLDRLRPTEETQT